MLFIILVGYLGKRKYLIYIKVVVVGFISVVMLYTRKLPKVGIVVHHPNQEALL